MEEGRKNVLLKVKDLVVEYTQENKIVKAVNGISFEVANQETIGLIGETGAGKTTVAKSILRILPVPQAKIVSGSIEFEGKNLVDMTEDEVRQYRGDQISMIFQDPMTALNPTMQIGKQIAEGIVVNKGVTKKEANEQAMEMLEMVGIPRSRFKEYPHQFSGGMKQRVVIALALACNPKLLIADEPTTALDVTIQAQVLDLIKELQRKRHTAMIMITHDFGIVAETCDKVAVVYAGEIIEMGTKRQIFTAPTHPYTKGLFNAIPSMVKEDRLTPIKGNPVDPTNLPEGCSFSPRCPYATEECFKKGASVHDIGDGHLVMCHLAKPEQ